MKKKKIGWEDLILEVIENHNGVATLKELYTEVHKSVVHSKAKNLQHNIRAYLRRLKKKESIKQVGISTYALQKLKIKNNTYENILNQTIDTSEFLSIPKNKVHGYIEGMLIEIGNLKGFDTYTPDKNIIFNGKSLLELSTHKKIPVFTYSDKLKKIEKIDVIWFQDGFPIKTFDVEHSTDFTQALVRSYQLEHFKTECFMIADKRKEKIFQDRIQMKPFNKIKKNIKFLEKIHVFLDYQKIVNYSQSKEKAGIERSYKAAQKADVILWVIDSSKPNFAINFQKLQINIPILLVFNKMDLRKITEKEIPKEYQNLPRVFVSALQKDIGQKMPI